MPSHLVKNKTITHKEYVDVLKNAALSLGRGLVLSHLAETIPWIVCGPQGIITKLIVEKVLSIFIFKVETQIFFWYVDLRVIQQQEAFDEAALKNYLAVQSGNPEQIAVTEKELIEKFKKFAKFSV